MLMDGFNARDLKSLLLVDYLAIHCTLLFEFWILKKLTKPTLVVEWREFHKYFKYPDASSLKVKIDVY
jgi:hypothetical protein